MLVAQLARLAVALLILAGLAATARAQTPIRGFADLHAHQFSYLGFGGVMMHGKAFARKPPPPFPQDLFDEAFFALPNGSFAPSNSPLVGPAGNPAVVVPIPCVGDCPAWCTTVLDVGVGCFGIPIHGLGGIEDLVGSFLSGQFGHKVHGWYNVETDNWQKTFNGWPAWNSYTHQQMYWRWLRRAWQGGQRLMVVHAVNNEVLCGLQPRRVDGFGCNDMDAVDRQIAAAKDLEAYIAEVDGGWYRIAYSPQQAREIMADGHLAVILGIEVSNLFGCARDGQCTQADVSGALDEYYDKGVRHVFPIHEFDNAFGGASVWQDFLNLGNQVAFGAYQQVENCASEGYAFRLAGQGDPIFQAPFLQLIAGLIAPGAGNLPPYPAGAHCNERGLSALGEFLIDELMARGMIIDLDHMSRKTRDDVLSRLDAVGYPGVAVSHADLIDTTDGEKRSEHRLQAAEIARIRDLGGVVGVIVHDNAAHETHALDARIPNNCDKSSKTFAQQYLRAVDLMAGGAVALGTDFNGLAGHPAPRLPPDFDNPGVPGDACAGSPPQGFAQFEEIVADPDAAVRYPFNVEGYPFTGPGSTQTSSMDAYQEVDRGTLNQQNRVVRRFSYNFLGLAHVGLIPDFIRDLRALGMNTADLEPLFGSAEAYVSMWEGAACGTDSDDDGIGDRCDDNIGPSADAGAGAVYEASSASGAVAFLDDSASSDPDDANLTFAWSGAFAASPLIDGPRAPGGTSAELPLGSTLLTLTVTDSAGQSDSDTALYRVVDTTAPVVSFQLSPAANAAGWYRTPVTVTFAASDAVTAPVACAPAQAVISDNGIRNVPGVCTDGAGNEGSASATFNLDSVAPAIAASVAPAANAAGWHAGDATVTFACDDALSGVAACPGAQLVSAETAGQTVAGTALDVAGNSASTSVEIRLDRTPPVVAATVDPAPNAAGWHAVDAQVSFDCSDTLSGVAACSAATTVFAETAGQLVSGSGSDVAGNSRDASLTVRLDRTPPSVAASVSPAPNAAGWHRGDALVSFTCDDTLSGVQGCAAPEAVTEETAGRTVTGAGTDLGGNTADASLVVRLDRTPPSVVASTTPAANAAGWHRDDALVGFECADALSGVDTCAAAVSVSVETVGQIVEGDGADGAGNTASGALTVRLDRTPPAITASVAPTPNAAGWHRDDARVSFACDDALSGIAACPATETVASEGAGQVVAGTALDVAGNPGETNFAVSLDRTPPAIVAFVTPAANAAGWHRDDALVGFECTDALSGVTSCSPAQTVSSETAGQSVPGEAADVAGNSAGTALTVRLDRTDPIITASINPAPNAAGWHRDDALVSFACTDALSGVDACSAQVAVSAETPGRSITGEATDVAGNTADTALLARLDRSAPIIDFAGTCPDSALLRANASFDLTIADALSGVAARSHDDGTHVLATDVVGEQTFTVTATDVAGNEATSECVYRVLYDFAGGGGFSSPVDNPPVTNTAKAGRTIPIKWKLPDGNGGFVTDLGAVRLPLQFRTYACGSTGTGGEDEIEAEGTGKGLRVSGDGFIFNWQTPGTLAGQCVALVLGLNDSSEHVALFRFR